LLEAVQRVVIRFDSNAVSGYFAKQNTALRQQRFNIAKLAMDRPGACSDDSCNIGRSNFMLLFEQQLYNSALPS
jgi:hypothetical protein